MGVRRLLKPVALVAVFAGMGIAGFVTRDRWLPLVQKAEPAEPAEPAGEAVAPTGKIIVNEQAQLNLGLTAKPLKAETYWKTIQVPGMVVDRPGLSDRGVVAPVTGVVGRIHHVPGDTVRPGEVLFTLKILSEPLHQTQSDLFKAMQDIALAEAEKKRGDQPPEGAAGRRPRGGRPDRAFGRAHRRPREVHTDRVAAA